MPWQEKYPKEKRLEIGKEIYNKEINKHEAAIKYNISVDTARSYYRLYKATLTVKQENDNV